MEYQKFKFNAKTPTKIVFLGDVHHGSKYSDTEAFIKTLNKIKADKNIKVILMGDLIENASALSVGSGVYEQTMNPAEQVKEICAVLMPIKKQILYMHRGNHEERSFRFSGFDIGQSIADSLGVPYVKNMCLTDIDSGKQTYRIYTWHGYGSSQTSAGRIRILQKQAEVFSADALFMGHVHELYSTTLPKREIVNGKFQDVFNHYVLTGAYLKWDESYAEQHGYRMVKMGCPLATFDNKSKSINIDLEWEK